MVDQQEGSTKLSNSYVEENFIKVQDKEYKNLILISQSHIIFRKGLNVL